MSKARVVSAFPGTGKSFLFDNNLNLRILDSDSSQFSWVVKEDGTKERNPEFPTNYINRLLDCIKDYDLILVSSHKEVRDALIDNLIPFDLVYPSKNLKEEYLERYRQRRSGEKFIQLISDNWDAWIDELSGIESKLVSHIQFTDEDCFISDLVYTKESISFTIHLTPNRVINYKDIIQAKADFKSRLEGYNTPALDFIKELSIK